METLENFRLVAQQVNPNEFAVIINKANIVAMASN
jgi:hypothetical protein